MNFKASTYFLVALLTSQCSSKPAPKLSVKKYCDRVIFTYRVTMHTFFNNGKKIGDCSFHTTKVCQLEGGFTASREDGTEYVTVKKGSKATRFGFREGGCVKDNGVELIDF